MAKFIAKSHLISLKDKAWFENQKHAGECVAKILVECKKTVLSNEPNLSLKKFEDITNTYMSEFKCEPTFKGYKGFPSALCASVNEQLVHGIVTDYILQDGDVVKLDLGATYKGAIADSAITCIYGTSSKEHIRLVNDCNEALYAGIKAVKVGNHIGAIGDAIYKYAKNTEFGLVTEYGGHGIDTNKPHAAPFIANKAKANDGVRIQPGFTLAIEPMLVIGLPKTKVLNDGWTVVTPKIGAHFEHTLYVESEDKVHIITHRENDVPYYREI